MGEGEGRGKLYENRKISHKKEIRINVHFRDLIVTLYKLAPKLQNFDFDAKTKANRQKSPSYSFFIRKKDALSIPHSFKGSFQYQWMGKLGILNEINFINITNNEIHVR